MLWYVAIGSAIGGMSRFLLTGVMQRMFPAGFPAGTLVINVTGSAVLGFLLRYAVETPAIQPELRALLTVGFCGGYTTFSTFSYETLALVEDGDWKRAGVYVAASVAISVSSLFQALAGLPNACLALPDLVTGGQPTADHLAAFKAAGGVLVLDLRHPREPRPLDQPATLERLGIEYVVVPVVADTATDETLDRIRATLRAAKGRKILFHCASASRVGAALIPYLVLDEEMAEEDAIAQALRVGLRSEELLGWAVDYVRRLRKA
jgi:CrcB protein